MIEHEDGSYGEIRPIDEAVASLKAELQKSEARLLRMVVGKEEELKAIKARAETEAYWREKIAGEIRAMPRHPDSPSHVMLDIADAVEAAFVRGKTREG